MAHSSTSSPTPDNVRDLVTEVGDQSILPADFGLPVPGALTGPGVNSTQAIFSNRNRVFTVQDRCPGWWSPQRDNFLWTTMLGSDVLSSAIYSTSARLTSVPVRIRARDQENRNNRRISMWSDLLLDAYWPEVAFQFAVDWQTQDNGAFCEIMGAGEPDGPIEPTNIPGTNDWIYGTGLRILDSQQCQRTGDATYPVVYRHRGPDGRWRYYKFHESRIIYSSQMPSSREEMFGIGFSGASRAIHNILRLDDIRILEDELLGVRPISQMVFGRGISAENMEMAFSVAEEKKSVDNKRRTAQLVFLGLTGNPELVKAAGIEFFDIKHFPEGYNPEVSLNLAINVLSMALGFDPRELWPATVRGATRADAEVQHWKSMMKTPGIWISSMTQQLNKKWCPNVSVASFDQQDDEQARSRADLRYVRAQTRELDKKNAILDNETIWQLMLEDADISETQYLQLLKRAEDMRVAAEQARQDAINNPQTDPNATPADPNAAPVDVPMDNGA